MQRKSFTYWYVSAGFLEIISIWKRFVVFIPHFFSFNLFLRTLFSPWHRDVSAKNWTGINPLKSLERFMWNIFARIIGAIVRIGVIVAGVAVWVAAVVFMAGIVFIYIFAPLIFVISLLLYFTPFKYEAVVLAISAFLIVLFVYRTYRISGNSAYEEMDMLELIQQKWFYRVFERIGVDKEDVPSEALDNFELFKQFLAEKEIAVKEFEEIIKWETEKQLEREASARFFAPRNFAEKRPIGLNWNFGYTVNLDRYTEDITKKDQSEYAYFPFCGFNQEMEMLKIILARPNENSVMITAQSGAGRHMVVHELARRIRTGYYGNSFFAHMRVLLCDLGEIIASAKNAGKDPENILRNLFHEAAYAGNVIFVVSNFEKYLKIDEHQGFSFAAIVDHYASLESFRMIGIATDDDFHEYIEPNSILMRHFDVLPIKEMSDEDAMKVLFMHFYGKKHTPFTFQALRQILIDSERYMNTAPLPMRAINLATEVLIAWQSSDERFITAQTVNAFVAQKTGVRVGDITVAEKEKLLSLEEIFHEKIVGQDSAVKTVASAIRRMRSGMTDANKPAGTFLFLGPTGVGKTEVAKTVADYYFGAQDKVIRIDMSEFQGSNALESLIGSKELKQQGILTTQAREHPYALLLLDEIEKANSRVLDIFLQILDEGFLHDAFGKKVSFTSMIIIATSNAGSSVIEEMVEDGVNPAESEKQVVDALIKSNAFRPEFLNRFDDIVIFEPLSGEKLEQVSRLLLNEFIKRVKDEQNITLSFNEEVSRVIIDKGFDPVFGARSILHYINNTVSDALAKKIIKGNVKKGESLQFEVADMSLE